MARLPSDRFLIQCIDDVVIVFEQDGEREIARWPVRDTDKMVDGMKAVSEEDSLSAVDKAFAHFWAGYFYAHMVYPEIGGMPEWAKTGWVKTGADRYFEERAAASPEYRQALLEAAEKLRGPDTSKSFLPGTQWGVNAAYKSDGKQLSREDREDVESEFSAWLVKMDELYPGIDFTLIPRPSWETTGLVGSVEDINAVMDELEAAEPGTAPRVPGTYEDD
jgi:hypothetical protein